MRLFKTDFAQSTSTSMFSTVRGKIVGTWILVSFNLPELEEVTLQPRTLTDCTVQSDGEDSKYTH